MSRKQPRPLFSQKQEKVDFPFDLKDVNQNDIKSIDIFRMYNCLKMVIEKVVEDQTIQSQLQENFDIVFRVITQKDIGSQQQQKQAGKKNQAHINQKNELTRLIDTLNHFGYTTKQIQDRLKLQQTQNSTQFSNGTMHCENIEFEKSPAKKQHKEQMKQELLIERQQLHQDVYHSDEENGKK